MVSSVGSVGGPFDDMAHQRLSLSINLDDNSEAFSSTNLLEDDPMLHFLEPDRSDDT
jgi:hypothetical protein